MDSPGLDHGQSRLIKTLRYKAELTTHTVSVLRPRGRGALGGGGLRVALKTVKREQKNDRWERSYTRVGPNYDKARQ